MKEKNKLELELKPCPFCGEIPQIGICDREGNFLYVEEDYEDDPRGLYFYISHQIPEKEDPNAVCPIASHRGDMTGTQLYESREELITRWNKRI